MRTAKLPSGESIPILGQGTWNMGDNPARRNDELAALRLGLDLGLSLIDTAEMYGNGKSESLVGEAIAGRRDAVFLVSKVLPSHASRTGIPAACHASLKRLKTDHLDLYLLHWPGQIPLEETVAAFEKLTASGAIRHWGVSNFDVADMESLLAAGGSRCATNQVLYNPLRRGIEFDLLPWSRRHHMPIMAYSPIEQGAMARDPALQEIAAPHNASPAQIALAWLLRQDQIIPIPKAANPTHIKENHAALTLHLTDQDLQTINRAFPPPTQKTPLAML